MLLQPGAKFVHLQQVVVVVFVAGPAVLPPLWVPRGAYSVYSIGSLRFIRGALEKFDIKVSPAPALPTLSSVSPSGTMCP